MLDMKEAFGRDSIVDVIWMMLLLMMNESSSQLLALGEE
jgi:hypothetical protein